MRNVLLVVGILLLVACVLSLAFSLLNLFGYYRVMDGSESLYHRLRQRMTVSLIVGIVLAALGAACLIVRARI
ncbi:MAG: hypothetical protein J5849_05375 [Clostridia bacterium]|nr:hypothetical protein [Clostridia bacterium]